MKRVEQTELLPPLGNCYQACIASIFECEIDDVPAPADTSMSNPESWAEYEERIREEFLRPRGLTSGFFGVIPEWYPEGYAILSAKSPRGNWEHAVVVKDGRIVWDPHPQRDMGVGEWKLFIVFMVLNPADTNRERHDSTTTD